jgi:hypothetical protein
VHVLLYKEREYGSVGTFIHVVVFMVDMASRPQVATFTSLELNVTIKLDEQVLM